MSAQPQPLSHESKLVRTSTLIADRRYIPQVSLELHNVTYAPIVQTIRQQRPTTTNENNKTKNTEFESQDTTKRVVVLSNLSTTVSPHKLTAWMGPSGSGKTSLLSVAAGLADEQNLILDSVVSVNGEEGRIPKRLVGVVWQDDLMLPNLTVEETIYFSARLKTPRTVSNEEVNLIVDEVMQDLGVLHIRESLIGNTTGGIRGISGGERKRVSVASELVVRPPLLLLDEPTSGLDATSAQALIKTLKDLARMGHSVAVVIHQPRTAIYNMFDHLLLLSKGQTIYNGSACGARAHLEACPIVERLPPETGIADWMMDVISADESRPEGPRLPQHWKDADTSALADCQPDAHGKRDRRPSLSDLKKVPKFETSFWVQLKLLLSRTLKQQRGERLTLVAAVLTFTYSFFTSLFWWRIPDDTNRIYERNSLLFFMLIAQSNQVVIGSMQTFSRESNLLSRERAKKMYRVLPFFIAKTLSDMTNNVLLPMLYGMIVYWTANLRPTAAAFFMFLLSYYLTMSTAQSMGLFLSIAIPNTQIALILAPAITLFFMILGGFYIPLSNIHVGIRWATWLSFARYGYSSQIVNEYAGRTIPCSTDGVSISIGGNSDVCPLPGEEVLYSLGIEGISTNYWFNIGMIVVLQVFFRVAAYILLRRSK